ncbi:thaumatin-like protein 1b isoform X2 [Momordica charantia]|uniref:Thaumatin-like protein 1b isoform X2 n=1 Tax=Momordica charantia TaxID=3673 RepID=A0A6J1CWX2_MOMCH|nr:thaumatin-like protein 1b isoform X2 [Momordica charantia]
MPAPGCFSRTKESKVPCSVLKTKPKSSSHFFFHLSNSMDRPLLLATLFTLLLLPDVQSTSFKLVNKCRTTIWPGLLSGAGTAQLPTTGFSLRSGKSRIVPLPKSWSGRLWGRTLCGMDSDGKFSCLTGDCGSGKVECAGGGAKPPATLAEFTLNGADGLDFYDVSLVDGYNLPMLIVAKGGTRGGCAATGCLVDLNGACPTELRVARAGGGRSVACRSACEAFNAPQFCCSDAFSTPDTCRPSVYSEFFKHACPRAYSYAYDDKTSTFTCASADYLIIFCPLPYTSQKVLSARKDGAALPLVNKTMMYLRSRRASGVLSTGR